MFEMRILSKRAVIVLASLCVLSFAGCKIKDAPAPAPTTQTTNAGKIDVAKAEPSLTNIVALPVKGNPNAKITIVEFSDYECPFCKKAEPTVEEILKAYPNDVRVAFINRPLPMHKNAIPAAKAAVAAMKLGGVDAYWKMHAKCFENNKALTTDNFKKWAGEIGLDPAAFEVAMNSDEVKQYVDKSNKVAEANGITGTPAFFINGVKVSGAQPFAKFKATIDAEIKRADDVAKAKNLSGQALYEELVNTAPKPPAPPAPDLSRKMVDLSNAPIIAGDPNAPVTIVEFTDFECPFCAKGNATIHELIEKNPGKAKLIYFAYPLAMHKNAPLAHKAAEAAKAQGKLVEYYNILFNNRNKLDRDSLIGYARQLGLDETKFVADMDSPQANAALQADMAKGNKAGVNGTPHFLFNGKAISGAQPLNNFQKLLDEEVKIAEGLAASGVPTDKIYEEVIKRNIGGGAKPEAAPAPAPAPAPVLPMNIPQGESYVYDLSKLPMKGNPNAKVTILEFSDYQCPYCLRMEGTVKQILEAYPDDVRFAYVNFPLPPRMHPEARPAAMAALAAGQQGKYWEMHEKLFANQRNLNEAFYIQAATELGLDIEKFKADIKNPDLNGIIQKGMNDSQPFEVGGTPAFLINGFMTYGVPFDQFKKIIDDEIARADRVAAKCNLSGDALYKKLVEKAPKPKNPEDDYHFTEVAGFPVSHFDANTNAMVPGAAPDALVTIVEFTDFQCPFCARGNATVHELMAKNPGKINFVFRHNPLPPQMHPQAQLAHQAAEAVKMIKPELFWAYYDTLFANQNKLDRDSLIAFAKELGLDETEFVAKMDSAEAAAAVEAGLKAGADAGVEGTPYFLVNGHVISGAQPIQKFQAVFDAEYKKAEELKASDSSITNDKIFEEVVKREQNKPVEEVDECN